MDDDMLGNVQRTIGGDRVAQLRGDVTRLESNQLLRHHHSSVCSGNCCLHGTSTHSVCRFPRLWRNEWGGILEHVCSHGVGHACPGSMDTVNDCYGCCRCCAQVD